jgi:hypothetical protein
MRAYVQKETYTQTSPDSKRDLLELAYLPIIYLSPVSPPRSTPSRYSSIGLPRRVRSPTWSCAAMAGSLHATNLLFFFQNSMPNYIYYLSHCIEDFLRISRPSKSCVVTPRVRVVGLCKRGSLFWARRSLRVRQTHGAAPPPRALPCPHVSIETRWHPLTQILKSLP